MARDTMPTPLVLQQHGSAPKNSHGSSDKNTSDPEQPASSSERDERARRPVQPDKPRD